MIRVCAIAIFFFGIGLFASFFITREITKIFVFIGCILISYGMFFRCK
ncbi:MAG: hypothetical protein ACOX1S_05870 [Anaerostipes sp.]